jgi:hypothetical protein
VNQVGHAGRAEENKNTPECFTENYGIINKYQHKLKQKRHKNK